MTYGRTVRYFSLAILTCLVFGKAHATDPVGFYIGGAVGQSRVDASLPINTDFRETHAAFKVLAGIRPISLIGAEFAYVDFGHPTRHDGFLVSDVRMKGESAFGVLYLPVPLIDIFLKAGLARIESTATTNVVCPPGQVCIELATPAPIMRTNVGLAAGVGAQYSIGSLGVRAEYERFNASGGNPSLLSAGVVWKF